MAQVVSINFHQTFRPEKQYIAALLELAGAPSYKSVKEISQLTGIPTGESSGKVEPHIIYAGYMGLIAYEKREGEYSLTRTKLGEAVYIEDPGLQENLTALLCHGMMQREVNGAPLWSAVFRKVLPRYRNEIKKDMLLRELNTILEGNVTVKNIAPFYGSYDSFFDSVDLLDDRGEAIKLSSAVYNKEFIYVYAFVLLEYWKERYPTQDEITSDQLDALCYGDVFGWDEQEEYKVLEQLSDKGIIRMNRQLAPYTILRLVESENLIGKLYSELC